MIQYIINEKNSCKLIRSIYAKFLFNDKDWHYFYEGDYMLLRLRTRNSKIENYFKAKKVKFNYRKWEDANEIVRKYQSLFKDIFHSYAVLSMELRTDEYWKCLDRVIHCFCNMSWELRRNLKISESQSVAWYLINKAQSEGYYRRLNEEKTLIK